MLRGRTDRMNDRNTRGQPVGFSVPDWQVPALPSRISLAGRFCRLEPLAPERHAADLDAANSLDTEGGGWTYLFYGPFADSDSYRRWLDQQATSTDPLFFAIIDQANGKAVGLISYLRIAPAKGSIEIGHLKFSPLLQKTPMATEALFLMIDMVFKLGYRRCEWKCDSLNQPSRNAAERLGFIFEGIFRQDMVYKGRNRDTAWYSIIDREWPDLKKACEAWLAPQNFDQDGRQKQSLRGFVEHKNE